MEWSSMGERPWFRMTDGNDSVGVFPPHEEGGPWSTIVTVSRNKVTMTFQERCIGNSRPSNDECVSRLNEVRRVVDAMVGRRHEDALGYHS